MSSATFLIASALVFNHVPIWEENPQIVCTGKTGVNCSVDGLSCTNEKYDLVWSIDFENKQVKYITLDVSETIVATHSQTYDDLGWLSDTVLLSSGRTIKFSKAESPDGTFLGRMMSDDNLSIGTIDLECKSV